VKRFKLGKSEPRTILQFLSKSHRVWSRKDDLSIERGFGSFGEFGWGGDLVWMYLNLDLADKSLNTYSYLRGAVARCNVVEDCR
jgi:hypothetical protein